MKNRKIRILTLSLFLVLTLLYILVSFAFYFQRSLSTEIQYLFPISIFILFHLFALLTILTIRKLNISIGKKIISIMIFIVINTALLYSLSSIKRESEIQVYFTEHEQRINNIIDYYEKNGKDNEFSSMLREMNIRSFSYVNDEYHIGLYSFLGYGYRILSTKKENVMPLSPGGSPTKEWFEIRDNWYYYSYWD